MPKMGAALSAIFAPQLALSFQKVGKNVTVGSVPSYFIYCIYLRRLPGWVIFHRYERNDTKYRTTHSELESDS
jgi:hypothetical protein